ncbi:MAG: hypothetical protein F6K58_12945 [Symploca sp. SIO2E9]|nr:hypothetical protein [Symploca sp. SIO2E9]
MKDPHQLGRCPFVPLLYWFVVVFFTVILGFAAPASASTLPTRIWDIPAVESDAYTTQVLLPDWGQITFKNLPAASSNGTIENLGRSWKAGQTPDQFLQLGDISSVLNAQILSVGAIEQLPLESINLDSIALSSFPLAGEQIVSHLSEIVPNLGQFKLGDVAPLSSLASQILGNAEIPDLGSIFELPIAQVISQFPAFAKARLNSVDLEQFAFTEIPNLESVSLEKFTLWQEQPLTTIPNLNSVPLSSFPKPVAEAGNLVMRIDMIYTAAEGKRHNTVSGSDVEGFAVDCETDCAYIELDNLENTGRKVRAALEGKQWISGRYQQVQGGHGCLAGVNGGKEPTGRHPFGSLFKLVVEEPDETTDAVNTALYFRFSNLCGHTPYFVGPIPFFSYRINSPIFLGALHEDPIPSLQSVSEPTEAKRNPGSTPAAVNCEPTSANEQVLPATYMEGVDVALLGRAIAALESAGNAGYQTVGAYVCADGDSHCGVALGKYQLMSYRDDVRQSIRSVPGGVELLVRIDRGYQPTQAEVFQYFPPVAQNNVFQNALARDVVATRQQIDPTTDQPFTGTRLVERVAQKHFGGAASKADASYSDIHNSYSLKSYGERVRQLYNSRRGAFLSADSSGNNFASGTCIPTSGSSDQSSTGDVSSIPAASPNSILGLSELVLKVFLSLSLVKVPSCLGCKFRKLKYSVLLGLSVGVTAAFSLFVF